MNLKIKILLFLLFNTCFFAQYEPKNWSATEISEANAWVEKTYANLTIDEKLGQLFIVALYTNKGDEYIDNVRQLVEDEKIGGLILMQEDAIKHIQLLNEFQNKSKVKMLVGVDAEWGLYQRINTAHKLPWAITLGAIQDKSIITEYASQIAKDAKKMGINWNFAPVVDVNTNPENPIIGNRSFGSEVENVFRSAMAYTIGLQDNGVLAAIKHFPGHGDTSVDSHHDLPILTHRLQRLNKVELAPFRMMVDRGVGGVMVAHLYVPALEKKQGIPASVSYDIITKILKEKYGYKGLIITDALNMGAVAKHFKPGELDAEAFKAGNDIMLFSEGVKQGKLLIKKAIESGEISEKRLEESVKKILLTKYYLGLKDFKPLDYSRINTELNTENHRVLAQKVYANAITLLKDRSNLLPLKEKETYYYVPLEEASHETFINELKDKVNLIFKNKNEIHTIPIKSKIIVGFHKDNSTAYKPFKISDESKILLKQLSKKHSVILNVFGSPYALKDINISCISTVLVSYENNEDSMKATSKALLGKHKINGRLPVLVNKKLKPGAGMDKP